MTEHRIASPIRHDPAEATRTRMQSPLRVLRRPLVWIVPIGIVAVVSAILSSLYLAGALNTERNLDHFPIAIVDNDTGASIGPNGTSENIGRQIVGGLTSIDDSRFALEPMTQSDALARMDRGALYGAIVIPGDFSRTLRDYTVGSISPAAVRQPEITVLTNPSAGTLAGSLLTGITRPILARVDGQLGQKVVAQAGAAARADRVSISGTARSALASPIDIVTSVHNPLPDGAGNGLGILYFTVLIVIAGFSGCLITVNIIDGLIGHTPSDTGPIFRQRTPIPLTRVNVLLARWAVTLAIAPIVAAIFLGVAKAIGMPEPHAWQMWGFTTLAIIAVGITSHAIMAAFGGLGMVVNFVIFVAAALPSIGATVPLEAMPRFIAALANFEPMRQIYLGLRSIAFYDAQGDAGLSRGLFWCVAGLTIGLVLGLGITWFYDSRGFVRLPHRGDEHALPASTLGVGSPA